MHPIDDTRPSLRLRPASQSDAERILWLEEVCMKDHATALWGHWRPAGTLDEFDVSEHEMIEIEGMPDGCLSMRKTDNAIYLSRLFIAPDTRNRGVGARILRLVIARAARQCLPIKLSVLTPNPAFRFYQRHGFDIAEKTRERIHMIRHYTATTQDTSHENY